MKKKHKKAKKRVDIQVPNFVNLAPISPNIKVEIIADEHDHSVNIRLTGFEQFDDVIDYSEFLSAYLPLLLYHTEVVH